jgi:hypothetical protein
MFAAELTDKELKLIGHPARKRIAELLGATFFLVHSPLDI